MAMVTFVSGNTFGVQSSQRTHQTVERTYSDFQWLHNQLQQQFAGCVVPPFPSNWNLKSIVGYEANEQDDQTELATRLQVFLLRTLSHDHLQVRVSP
jgi:hypothetical protein